MNGKTRYLIVTVILTLSLITPALAQDEPELPPLAERGPYGVGTLDITFVDASREDRELVTTIWYPAIIPEGEEEQTSLGLTGAEPDTSGAPYPLILHSHAGWGNRFYYSFLVAHLASHGFVVAAMDHKYLPTTLVDQPLDILFALDQLTAITEGDLAGMIDSDRVGIDGVAEYGAVTAVLLTGAQIDPEHFLELCAEQPMSAFDLCFGDLYTSWDEVVAYRAQFEPPLETGQLWPPFADERIHAVLLMEPCDSPLFGERGLTAATVPTLLLARVQAAGGFDYEEAAVYMYTHLGAEERHLLTFLRYDFYYREPELRVWINHFATVFFGYYLQGQEDYAQYLTAEYVEGFEDLAWGAYEEPEE